jgi:hypothetical protein
MIETSLFTDKMGIDSKSIDAHFFVLSAKISKDTVNAFPGIRKTQPGTNHTKGSCHVSI